MGAQAFAPSHVTVEEFLAAEELSLTKHEYLGGVVYDMAGADDPHNYIEINLTGMLYNGLRGRRCNAFGSNMKLRLHYPSSGSTYFYYPDAMVVCNPHDQGRGWREQPAALFEVLSESTRQIDGREKRIAYLSLPSLEVYVRIEQYRPEVTVDRRIADGWETERIIGLDAVISLPTLEIALPLAELYERVAFPNSTPPSSSEGASA